MDCQWAILMLTGAWLGHLVSGLITKDLCELQTRKDIIEDRELEDNEYNFTSTGCNSKPNAFVLKFETRNAECLDGNRNENGEQCSAIFKITAVEDKTFNTCDENLDRITCYVFLTTDFPFDSIPESGCNSTLLHRVVTMPDVKFEYEMCQDSSLFNLTYEYIIMESKPPKETENQGTPGSVTTTPKTTKSPRDSQVTTNAKFESERTSFTSSEGTPFTRPMSSKPLPQSDSAGNIAAIILGVLLIISLLALGILAIKYHKVTAFQKPQNDSHRVGEGGNTGEVVVNQVYDSYGDKKSGGEVVVNELYGHR